jgi:hypothetical protein
MKKRASSSENKNSKKQKIDKKIDENESLINKETVLNTDEDTKRNNFSFDDKKSLLRCMIKHGKSRPTILQKLKSEQHRFENITDHKILSNLYKNIKTVFTTN